MSLQQVFRAGALVAGALFIGLTAGFLLELPWVTSLWPFILEETRLGHIFLSSITIAIAMPALWIAATGSIRSAAAGTIDLAVMFTAMAVFLISRSSPLDRAELTSYGVGAALLATLLFAAFVYAQRQPWIDTRPMPGPLQAAFVGFFVVLVVGGIQLVRQTPHIFPWPLAPESSVMYGFIFYGAAVYFLVGLMERRWASAGGQLIGFLAYDLVLIVPLLQRFGSVPPEHRPSLVVYTLVLIVGGVLALYYLLFDRRTRLVPLAFRPPPARHRGPPGLGRVTEP